MTHKKVSYYSDPLCRAVLFFCFKNQIYNKFLLDRIVSIGHSIVTIQQRGLLHSTIDLSTLNKC